MILSVIMPVYNEEKTVREIINRVLDVDIQKELIIVNDGSTDQTAKIIDEFQGQAHIKIIHQPENKGKGSAIVTGLKHIEGDIVIIQDGDLETDPNDYIHLVEPIVQGKTKVVYGSRILGQNHNSFNTYYFGGRFVTFVANMLYNQKITDEPTCYKVFERELITSMNLKCQRFEFCPEVTAKVSKLGHRIVELPMKYYPRSVKDGKKLNIADGIQAVWTLIKYRFTD